MPSRSRKRRRSVQQCGASRPRPRFTAPDRRAFIFTSLCQSSRRVTISNAFCSFCFLFNCERKRHKLWGEKMLVHDCFETRSEGFNEGWSVCSERLSLSFHVFDHCHEVGRSFCQATSQPNLHITGLLESIWPFYSRGRR